jgi:hypothetical protein
LCASWRPGPPEDEPEPVEESRSRLRRLTSAYGWRVYALPVLVVLTALVVFTTATQAPPDAQGQNPLNAAVSSGVGTTPPLATENPAKPADLDIPTAELPEGGEYTEAGKGTWHVIPGKGKKVGTGDVLQTYVIEVEDGIDPSSYAGDDAFAETVEATLSDPRGWTGTGQVSLQRVDASYPNPDFRVSLTTPKTLHRPDLCGNAIPYEASCRRSDHNGQDRVAINLARWVRGAKAFSGALGLYRQYAINHEVGHALGNGHKGCAEDGALAPVMMQQTFGVSNDYVAKLNSGPGGDQGAVPADGKTCLPNAWPNPQP